MAFLSKEELISTYYPKASSVDDPDVSTYLARANAFCKGVIGGIPPTVDDDLKVAVALAFEILSQGETGQVNETTGDITEAATAGQYARDQKKDPLDTVRGMLQPYKRDFEAANAASTDRGVRFV